MMKKQTATILFIGGIMLGTAFACGRPAQAADTLNGQTTVSAGTTAGDVTLAIGSTLDFGSQPLSPTIDFGAKELTYKVTDYSGDTKGYTLQAKVETEDQNRTLEINGKVVDAASAATVHDKKTNIFGENAAETLPVTLKYTHITEKKTLSFVVDWTLVKGKVQA